RADARDVTPAARGEEELRLGMLEVRVLARRQGLLAHEEKRWDEARVLAVKPRRKPDEAIQLGRRAHGKDFDGAHGALIGPHCTFGRAGRGARKPSQAVRIACQAKVSPCHAVTTRSPAPPAPKTSAIAMIVIVMLRRAMTARATVSRRLAACSAKPM